MNQYVYVSSPRVCLNQYVYVSSPHMPAEEDLVSSCHRCPTYGFALGLLWFARCQ